MPMFKALELCPEAVVVKPDMEKYVRVGREVRAMNYRKLSARPRHHAKNEAAVAAFKKTSRPVWRQQSQRPRLMAR